MHGYGYVCIYVYYCVYRSLFLREIKDSNITKCGQEGTRCVAITKDHDLFIASRASIENTLGLNVNDYPLMLELP